MRKSSVFTLSIILAVCLFSGCASTGGRNNVQLPEDEALSAIEFAMNDVRVPALLFDYIPIQTSVGYVNISWESSNKKICYQNDIWLEVRKQAEETDLTLTATFECSGYTAEKDYQVHVFGEQQILSDDEIQKLVLEDMIASFMWTGEEHTITTPAKTVDICVPKSTQF